MHAEGGPVTWLSIPHGTGPERVRVAKCVGCGGVLFGVTIIFSCVFYLYL